METKLETANRLLSVINFLKIATDNRLMQAPEAQSMWKQQLKEAGYKEHPKTTAQKAVSKAGDK